jgi:hypothetical protein
VARIAAAWTAAGDARPAAAFARALEAARAQPPDVESLDALTQIAAALAPSSPGQAKEILNAAQAAAWRLEGVRARGRALSRIAGAWMALDAARAVALLADLRRLGRANFLDGVAQIAPGTARLGGTALVGRVLAALEEGERFFRGA